MNGQIRTGLCVSAIVVFGCSSGETAVTDSVDVVEAGTPISGIYKVSGVTIDLDSGDRREISGAVVLTQNGDAYTATFDLDTLFPTGEGALEAEVIGSGSGRIEGRELTGTSETQIVISTVPGIDPGFAFVPRTTTTRIVSQSTATIALDGGVKIQIDSRPAEGEKYAPTRTTIAGHRVGAAGVGGDEPDAGVVDTADSDQSEPHGN